MSRVFLFLSLDNADFSEKSEVRILPQSALQYGDLALLFQRQLARIDGREYLRKARPSNV
jgi:hypothetical protein